MKKIACLMAEGFEEAELVIVVDLLRRAQFQVDLVSIDQWMVTSARKIVIKADKLFVDMDDYDMIYLPGGGLGAENLAKDKRVLKLIQDYAKKPAYIAAICAAPIILGQAGILDDKKITSYPTMAFDPRLAKSNYQNETVVIDGRIMTSRGVGTAIDFALALIKALGADDHAMAESIVYQRRT